MFEHLWKRNWRPDDSVTSSVTASVAVANPAPSTSVAVKEPPIPKSYEAKLELDGDEFAEYCKAAEAVGLQHSEALFNERIRHCCTANGFRIFNYEQVVEFLDRKLGAAWEWMGLRDTDVEHLGGWVTAGKPHQVPFSKKQYGRKIPLPVLLTVQRVLEDVPDAHFYVSGIPNVDDDPFLLVTARQSSSFVIERWDEPDFRER